MTELPNEGLMTENGMSPSWRGLALKLREGLEGFVDVSRCLPGEENFCGADYAHHCVSYAAAIKAYGEQALEHLHHGDPDIQRAADALTDRWAQTFASMGEHCTACDPPAVPTVRSGGDKS